MRGHRGGGVGREVACPNKDPPADGPARGLAARPDRVGGLRRDGRDCAVRSSLARIAAAIARHKAARHIGRAGIHSRPAMAGVVRMARSRRPWTADLLNAACFRQLNQTADWRKCLEKATRKGRCARGSRWKPRSACFCESTRRARWKREMVPTLFGPARCRSTSSRRSYAAISREARLGVGQGAAGAAARATRL